MGHNIIIYLLSAALAIALIVAAISDFNSRKISNRLNLIIALGAPLFWLARGLDPWPDMVMQIVFALGILLLFSLFFALKAIGGGDVKYLSALALWFPWLEFIDLLIIMALVGGLLALAMALYRIFKAPKNNTYNRDNHEKDMSNIPSPDISSPHKSPPNTSALSGQVPYGIAISIAALWVLHEHYINQLAP